MPPRGVHPAHGAFADMAPSKEQLEFAAQRLREAGLIGDKMPTSNHTVGSTAFWKDMEAAMVKPMETAVDERTGPVRFRPMNPMCDAAEQGDLPTLTVLLATGGNVNELGENGNSALAFACANGHADCTSLLISRGATVDLRSSLGNSPLHAACWADSPKCIRIPAWSKRPPLQCPRSARVPPQGAPSGSGRLGAPRGRPGHSDPGRCLGCSSVPPPKPLVPPPLTIQASS